MFRLMHLTILRDLMMKLCKNIAILALSVVLVSASAFLPTELRNEEDLKNVRLGLPLTFIIQDQSRYSGLFNEPSLRTSSGGARTEFSSIWENPTRYIRWAYLVNIAIAFGGFRLLEFLITQISHQNSSPSQ